MKVKTHKINFRKTEKADLLTRATRVGCEILLLPMGDILKFKSGPIKFTLKREIEE